MSNLELFIQPMWGNENFKHKNKFLFYRNWLASDFFLVKDLYQSGGVLLSDEQVLNIQTVCLPLCKVNQGFTVYLCIVKDCIQENLDRTTHKFHTWSQCTWRDRGK